MEVFRPHSYQTDGIEWILKHKTCGLFLPPGLGKTAIALSAINWLIKSGQIKKVLIIAPLRVIYMVWPQEIEKWGLPLSAGILHGPYKETTIRKKHDIYLINPEGLSWLFNNHSLLFKQYEFMLVCDESTLFKNHSSVRFKLLKKQLGYFDRRVILTGTPAPNGLLQIWPQMYLLDKGKRLGQSISKYKQHWFIQNPYNYGISLLPNADIEIYNAIDDIIMHKSNKELKLPEKLDNIITIDLPVTSKKIYKDMKNNFIAEIEGCEEQLIAINAADKALKLKQVANGIVYGEGRVPLNIHDEKLHALDELVDSLAGRPLLIVYEFLHDLDKLKKHFGQKIPHIGGGVEGIELANIVKKWNSGELPILFIQPQAAGHGLNLQDGGCCDVVWYSITFDLELYDQVNARVHRQGVKNSVTIHHIVAQNTVDERVMEVLQGKSKLQEALLLSLLK